MTTRRPLWHDAFDAQMGLWRWYRTPRSHDWIIGLYRDQMMTVPPANHESLARLYDAELGRLIDCDPLYVSADMCALVDAARDDFQPEPLLESDLPTPRGFLYYADPVTITDKYGNELPIRAVAWSQQLASTFMSDDAEKVAQLAERVGDPAAITAHGPRIAASEVDALVADGLIEAYGIAVALYTDTIPYLDIAFDPEARRNLNTIHTEAVWKRMREEQQRVTAGTPVVPVHLCPWHFGLEFDGNQVDVYGEPTGADQWWKLLQTTLRLMQQKLTHRSFGRPDRPVRREGIRLGFPAETEVVIVRLRHEQGDRAEPSGEDANYSHRFIVGGHWRNQWYPSEKLHRQVYIAPYVKGPEDKPLIVRPRRVFQWTR